MTPSRRPPRLLAISSGGGHWIQLLRLRAAFEGHDVAYATVQLGYASDVVGHRFHVITDATRWSRWKLIRMVLEVCVVVLKERPDVVISTGAAPGVVALRVGKWLGAKTIWLDSIANIDSMSLSGRMVRRFCDLWLTQWETLSSNGGPIYRGSVL